MRVIAGTARRIQLLTPPSEDTRPTTDRIKETLFNMLQPEIGGARFLDLFAGSGGIGIEALSRGASFAVFVERDRRALSCIRQNLERTHLAGQAQVAAMDAVNAISMLRAQEPFDIVFMDPPYERELEMRVLEALHDSPVIHEDTLLIVEASLKTSFDWLETYGYEAEKFKQYKTNQHVFIRKKA